MRPRTHPGFLIPVLPVQAPGAPENPAGIGFGGAEDFLGDAFIDRAQQGPLEAWSQFHPFNKPVRNVEMKSTDRKILILVASLALLLAGCGGGGSSTTAPVDPGPAPAETAIMEAETALMNAEDALEMLDASATNEQMRAAYQAVERAANNLVMVLKANGGSPAAVEAATTTRQTAMHMADNLAQKIEDDAVAADAAMTALAAKLYAAMDPVDDEGVFGPLVKSGNDTGLADNPGFLTVQNLNSVGSGHPLEEDKTAMVAPLNGWKGSRHTATVATGTSGAGTYTAHMYSDIEAPTPGKMFNAVYTDIDANGEVAIGAAATQPSNTASKIASPEFDHSAGVKPFMLPDPNPAGERIVTIDGSYDGVAGMYSCNTGTAGTDTCSVTKASGEGYTLTGSGTWKFKPGNPEDMLAPTPDTVYPVYGWWLHEEPDGTATVSPFTKYRGGTLSEPSPEIAILVTSSTNIEGFLVNPLFGTATYKGGAAGIYAISADADNDAGHFTADAELTATFNGGRDDDPSHTITGTIDSFVGSDGMSRDWSVELKQISIVGRNGSFNTPPSLDGKITTWSMGGTAASDSGEWGGTLYKKNDAEVPTVGTGMFYSEYENIGRMTGAFGVNLEE